MTVYESRVERRICRDLSAKQYWIDLDTANINEYLMFYVIINEWLMF